MTLDELLKVLLTKKVRVYREIKTDLGYQYHKLKLEEIKPHLYEVIGIANSNKMITVYVK